jgi:hypothetical protein
VWGWGFNRYGRLGQTFISNSLVPVQAVTYIATPPSQSTQYTINQNYLFEITATNVSDFENKQFTLSYSPDDFDLADLCALTYEKETLPGEIQQAKINIIRISLGSITLEVLIDVPTDEKWSGSVNVIKLKSKRSCDSTVSLSVINP